MYPAWLGVSAWCLLILCFGCSAWILFNEIGRPQKMWIMNLVWPITGLYLGPVAVWLYLRTRPLAVKQGSQSPASILRANLMVTDRVQTAVAGFHCGAGCTLGDIIGETAVPVIGLTFAGEFGTKLIVDFLLAYVLGIAFQYFTIVPMKKLNTVDGLKAALRADTISIALFEIGMFGWMGLSYFVFFPSPHLKPSSAVFWFMMQIAMIAGFLTSYPANQWLIRKGWKEKMPARQSAPKIDSSTRAA